MHLQTCDSCSGNIVSEPYVTSAPGAYYFTCSAVCRAQIEKDLERERQHQRVLALNDRALSLGKAAFNGW
jgi:hypothetical protein